MTVYCFNADGYFTGLSDCPLDPKATKRLGYPKYLVPPDATETAPPAFDPETQRAKWTGDAWEVKEIPPEPESPEPPPEDPAYTADDLFGALLGLEDNSSGGG